MTMHAEVARERRTKARRDVDTEQAMDNQKPDAGGGNRKGGAEKYKIQIQLSERAKDRLFDLIDQTEADSAAQVLRDALRVYDVLVKELSTEGSKLLLHRGSDRQTVEMRLF